MIRGPIQLAPSIESRLKALPSAAAGPYNAIRCSLTVVGTWW